MNQKYLVLALMLFLIQCTPENIEPTKPIQDLEIEFRAIQSSYANNQLVVYLNNPTFTPDPNDVVAIEKCPCNENLQLWTYSEAALQLIPIEERRRSNSDTDETENGFNVQFSVQQNGFDFPITPNNFADGINRIHTSSSGQDLVKIAILDTGIDYDHPSFPNEYLNYFDTYTGQGESFGYDFVNEDVDPNDDHGHGTAVAGRIISKLQDGRSDFPFTIMPIKTHDENGNSNSYDMLCAMLLAAANGADVINTSFGYYNEHNDVLDAILDDLDDVLFVASAGNDSYNNNKKNHFPSNFSETKDNMLSVAATNPNGNWVAPFSNWGTQTVDVGAEGVSINLVKAGGGSLINDGTSFAAPMGTASAADIIDGLAPSIGNGPASYSPAQIKDAVIANAKYNRRLHKLKNKRYIQN